MTPLDDAHRERNYPLFRLEARESSGKLLASATVTVPVFDNPGCFACHGSVPGLVVPSVGPANDPNPDRDYRLNILGKHDDNHLGEPLFDDALLTLGYDPDGLRKTVLGPGIPVRCTACHRSNALPGSGLPNISQLTTAVHARHLFATDPEAYMPLELITERHGCHRCHPGRNTDLLRRPMGTAVAPDGTYEIHCQDCHGPMSAMARADREGWLSEPACQSCHTGTVTANSGQLRYTSVFDESGDPREPADLTFATNEDVPGPGFSLYKDSVGDGGLKCAACHGSPHAEYPAAVQNDNLQALSLQGHAGKVSECLACHPVVPDTVTGGPHGLHPFGQPWVDRHGQKVLALGSELCRTCHGLGFEGSELSRVQADRTLSTPWGVRSFWRGYQVSCYACHNGPTGAGPALNTPPFVNGALETSSGGPVTINLQAGDANGDPLTFRVVTQPAQGRVTLSGPMATYHPEPGFAGADRFTVAAFDGLANSNLATVTVLRGAEWEAYGPGYPGTIGLPPGIVPTGPPALGVAIQIALENSSGMTTPALLVLGSERATIATSLGAHVLVQPSSLEAVTIEPMGLLLDWMLPDLPSLTGISLFVQSVQPDPAAVFGYAFSRGLRLTIGP